MSTTIDKKINKIRTSETLTLEAFGTLIGVGKSTIARYERAERTPSFALIQKLCSAFPQYTLYLMHDQMPLPRTEGQITPEEKKLLDQNFHPIGKEA